MVGRWTRDKLQILQRYLPAYLAATSRAIDRIYIDGFAGPGTNVLKASRQVIDGSPLIALKARATNGTAFTRLFFIEKDPGALAELKEAVNTRGLGQRATFVPGDVNVELPRIVHQLPRRAPTFVFLDAEGIDPEWTTIEAIAPWRTELLITYPHGMAINRNLESLKARRYFGTSAYGDILGLPGGGRTHALLDLYKTRLRQLGYEHTPPNDFLVKTGGNARLYLLVFASKVAIGSRIMKFVFDQPDASGQTRMKLQ
jgi:three-Cys-motif partner protein